jgi:chemotaxis response regulator CheB
MSCEEPKSIVNDADLFPMSADQRIAWRNKTIGEMKKIAPDLVEDLRSAAEKVAASKVETLLIGSSSGGPMALKEFFANLPRLNIAIFIAQHMPEAAYDLVLNQVKSSARNWDVSIAVHGEKALAGHAYLIPREVTLSINANSVIEFKPNATTPEFHPCINNAVRSIYSYSKDKTNIVILTGMGEDGAAALRELKGKARMILAQEPDSCASSSMPDAARKTNTVDRSGTPSELANLISESYGHGVSFLN